MTRLPSVTPRALVMALKRAGFVEHHQRGSHLYLWHPIRDLLTSVPMHPGDLPRGTLKAILRQSDLAENDLPELL